MVVPKYIKPGTHVYLDFTELNCTELTGENYGNQLTNPNPACHYYFI